MSDPDETNDLRTDLRMAQMELRDEHALRRSIEEMAETIITVWRRGRDGAFTDDNEFLSALETPIEQMERRLFDD